VQSPLVKSCSLALSEKWQIEKVMRGESDSECFSRTWSVIWREDVCVCGFVLQVAS